MSTAEKYEANPELVARFPEIHPPLDRVVEAGPNNVGDTGREQHAGQGVMGAHPVLLESETVCLPHRGASRSGRAGRR